MGHLEFASVSHTLPNGTQLLRDISFRMGEGSKFALIGGNGSGKTTLTRIASKEIAAQSGTVTSSGGLAIMPQFIGSMSEDITVQSLLLSVAPESISNAFAAVEAAEERLTLDETEANQMSYAQALADWGDLGGYDQEVLWDVACTSALATPFEHAGSRKLHTLSGGEQKRLVLEVLLRGSQEVLILDEPDNFLDVPSKLWLESQLQESTKTVLFVSHDRALISAVAGQIVTLEPHSNGNTAWVHSGKFSEYYAARSNRNARLEEQRRRWDEELDKLKSLVLLYRQKAKYNSDMASRLQSAETRLRRLVDAGPPELVPQLERVKMNLVGGRTAKRAVIATDLEITGLMRPFTAEIWFGERVAVLGSNGSGKSHFLRLMAAGGTEPLEEHLPVGNLKLERVDHTGTLRLGSRVRPGWFAQRHEHPELAGRTLLDIMHRGDEQRDGLSREQASRTLDRYGLARHGESTFDQLSGGQQARLQILLLELSGATLLLLDEPTDNLDLESVTTLEAALRLFAGSVVAVTHDRWFAEQFDRFFVFENDGTISDSTTPTWT